MQTLISNMYDTPVATVTDTPTTNEPAAIEQDEVPVQSVQAPETKKAFFEENPIEYETVEDTHTQTGEKIFVVKVKTRVSDFNALSKKMRELGAKSYYRKKGGFIFYSDPADKLSTLTDDSVSAVSQPETVENAPLPETKDTVNSGHTPEQQRIIQEYNNAVDPKIVEFLNTVKARNSEKIPPLNIGRITERQAADLKNLNGRNYEEYNIVIDDQTAKHIEKGHGTSGTSDKSMADINDIARIPYILENYDNMTLGNKSKRFTNSDGTHADTVLLNKRINGYYYILEAIPDSKNKTIRIMTAYKNNNNTILSGGVFPNNADQPANNGVAHTFGNEPSNNVINNTVPQNGDIVNADIEERQPAKQNEQLVETEVSEDERKTYNLYAELLKKGVTESESVRNAVINSDKENALLEIENVIRKVKVDVITEIAVSSEIQDKKRAAEQAESYFTYDKISSIAQQLYDNAEPKKVRAGQNAEKVTVNNKQREKSSKAVQEHNKTPKPDKPAK